MLDCRGIALHAGLQCTRQPVDLYIPTVHDHIHVHVLYVCPMYCTCALCMFTCFDIFWWCLRLCVYSLMGLGFVYTCREVGGFLIIELCVWVCALLWLDS